MGARRHKNLIVVDFEEFPDTYDKFKQMIIEKVFGVTNSDNSYTLTFEFYFGCKKLFIYIYSITIDDLLSHNFKHPTYILNSIKTPPQLEIPYNIKNHKYEIQFKLLYTLATLIRNIDIDSFTLEKLYSIYASGDFSYLHYCGSDEFIGHAIKRLEKLIEFTKHLIKIDIEDLDKKMARCNYAKDNV